MRRRIRLTGRKQLPASCVKVEVFESAEDKRVVALSMVDVKQFHGFAPNSKIRLRLYENKTAEILDFGTLAAPKNTVELSNDAFAVPSCQLRIVSADEENRGLLLGSTDSWSLKTERPQDGDKAKEGILLFMPKDIAPRSWKLEVRAQEHPIVYIDKSIPDSRTWVRTNPVFVGAVFPAIVHQVFDDILHHKNPADVSWMNDWLKWADTLMPGSKPPVGEDRETKQLWIDQLIDTFSQRHNLLGRLVTDMKSEIAA